MASSNPSGVVLVSGATGRHGGTGLHVLRRLLDGNVPVRALVRQLDDRAARLKDLGAEVVVGDLCDRVSLLPALDGVSSVYFTFPIDSGVVSAAANYAGAVRQLGVNPHTVVMSMGPARPDHPSALGRAQWLAEEVLEWAGLKRTVLRVAGQFHENVQLLFGRSVRQESVIRNSFGRTPVGWINGLDAAELGVAALLHPERFGGEAVHYLPGTEVFTYDEVAETLSNLLRRRIQFTPVSEDSWRTELEDLADVSSSPVNRHMAQHISAVGAVIAAHGGMRVPVDRGAFERLTGRAPVLLRDHFAAIADVFA